MFKNVLHKMLGPEQVRKIEKDREREERRKQAAKELSDEELADTLEYCLLNCVTLEEFNRLGNPVYESALVRIHIPEVLRRLRGLEETQPRQTQSQLAPKLAMLLRKRRW